MNAPQRQGDLFGMRSCVIEINNKISRRIKLFMTLVKYPQTLKLLQFSILGSYDDLLLPLPKAKRGNYTRCSATNKAFIERFKTNYQDKGIIPILSHDKANIPLLPRGQTYNECLIVNVWSPSYSFGGVYSVAWLAS